MPRLVCTASRIHSIRSIIESKEARSTTTTRKKKYQAKKGRICLSRRCVTTKLMLSVANFFLKEKFTEYPSSVSLS